MSKDVSEELVTSDMENEIIAVLRAYSDARALRPALNKILNAIAPRLKAEGMRKAATELYRAFRSSERFRDAPANLKLHDLLVETVDALNARADALDPPKETKS